MSPAEWWRTNVYSFSFFPVLVIHSVANWVHSFSLWKWHISIIRIYFMTNRYQCFVQLLAIVLLAKINGSKRPWTESFFGTNSLSLNIYCHRSTFVVLAIDPEIIETHHFWSNRIVGEVNRIYFTECYLSENATDATVINTNGLNVEHWKCSVYSFIAIVILIRSYFHELMRTKSIADCHFVSHSTVSRLCELRIALFQWFPWNVIASIDTWKLHKSSVLKGSLHTKNQFENALGWAFNVNLARSASTDGNSYDRKSLTNYILQ